MTAYRTALLVALGVLLAGSAAFAGPSNVDPDPGVPIQDYLEDQSQQQEEGDWELLSDPGAPTLTPTPRLLHTAILDPVGNRMLVYGGLFFSQAFSEVLTMPLGTSAGWSVLSTLGPSPGERRDHTAVYDPVRHRMIVFGGSAALNTFKNDVWALSLGGTPSWSQITPAGTSPPGRFAHAAAYDPVRDRMIVFGGFNGSYLGDVWALSLTTNSWTALTPAGTPPAPRNATTLIYDPDGDRLVFFGGWDGSQFRSDVWALSLDGSTAWSQVTAVGAGPSVRRHHAAVYDASRHRLVIQGGLGPSGYLSDAYALSLTGSPTWSALAVSGSEPSARNAHRAIYDPSGDRLIEFAGYGGSYLDDTHALDFSDGNRWSTFPPLQTGPTRRRDHIAANDPVRDRMLVFGGWDGRFRDDTWALSLSGIPTWELIVATTGTPPARFAHAGIYDGGQDRLVVFGGFDGTYRNDVWALSLSGAPVWTQLTTSGPAPVGRNAMTAVYDAPRHRMLVFGGWDGSRYLDDLWALELQGAPVWTRLPDPPGQRPSARRHYAAALDAVNDRLVIHGGFDGAFLNDAWEYRLSGPQDGRWARLQGPRSGAAPTARNAHRAVHDPGLDRFWFFGGYDGNYLQDTWALSLTPPRRWTSLEAEVVPQARLLHSATYDPARGRMLVFGGESFGNQRLSDTWALSIGPAGAAARIDDRRDAPMIARQETAPVAFALDAVAPNPIVGEMRVRFTLENDRPASLELFSIAGQRVLRHDVGGLGAGTHTVRLGRDVRLAPGLYVLRLSSPGRSASRRIAVVR